MLLQDDFSIWDFAQVYNFQNHVQDQNNSGNVLWGITLGGWVKAKVSHYDIIVGQNGLILLENKGNFE